MQRTEVNAPNAYPSQGGYAQAIAVEGANRLLFISGQTPVAPDGSLAADFQAQAAQAWANVEAQLRAAGMRYDNLVKVTIYLARREDRLPNRQARQAAIGDRRLAMTLVVAGIFDDAWLIEIEAIAAA